MSFGAQIVDEVRGLRGHFDPTNRYAVVDNLAFVYHLILASAPMLEFAAAKSPPSIYRDFLMAHAEEERDHAQWLERDFLEAGERHPDSHCDAIHDAAQIAGAQYYLTFHRSAYAVLGYMLVLECFPAQEHDVKRLEVLHGKALFQTLRYHATHDVDHGAEVLRQIDSMPLVYRELVRQNALRTVRAIAQVSVRFGTASAVATHG